MSVSNSVSKLRLGKIESWTRSQNWDSEIYSLGLGHEIEAQKFWVSDLVSKLRLLKLQSRTWSQNWNSENLSLRPGLEIQKLVLLIPVVGSQSSRQGSGWTVNRNIKGFLSERKNKSVFSRYSILNSSTPVSFSSMQDNNLKLKVKI